MPLKGGKKKVATRGMMGSIMPPVDVDRDEMMEEFVKRMKKGPVTLVLVYAPWCGHCVQYKPEFEKMVNTPNRSIQVAQLRDDMVNKAPLKNANINSYPSVIVVNKNGEVVEEIQDRNNTAKMNQILEEGVENQNKVAENTIVNTPMEQLNDVSKPTRNNITEDIASELEPVSANNVKVPNYQNDSKMSKKNMDSLIYKAAGGGCGCPFTRLGSQAGGNGGLYGLLSSVAQGALPAAALLGSAAILAKKRKTAVRKTKKKSGSRKTKRRSH